MKPSRESIETRITSCKLDITAGLLVLKDLLINWKKTVQGTESCGETWEKAGSAHEVEESSLGERLESSEEPKRKARKQSRVPSNLPTFRDSKGIEDPLEFIEQFERICQANEVDEDCYISFMFELNRCSMGQQIS